jgi:chromosome segregation ATPase
MGSLRQFATEDTVAHQTTGMTSAATLPQWLGSIASSTEPDDHTAPSEQQPDGHRPGGSDSSEESFVSATESIPSSDTQQAMTFLTERVAQLEISLQETTLERDELRDLENEITLERDKSQRLESEITLERDKLRGSENSTREIAIDCDRLRAELGVSRRQLEAAHRNSATLELQMQDLHLKSLEGAKELKRKVTELITRAHHLESGRDYTQAYQRRVWDGMESQFHISELLKQIEGYKAEAGKWRNEAYGKGAEAVSRCWQASVDEAVRCEREKDAFVMKVLRDEISALKSKKEG